MNREFSACAYQLRVIGRLGRRCRSDKRGRAFGRGRLLGAQEDFI